MLTRNKNNSLFLYLFKPMLSCYLDQRIPSDSTPENRPSSHCRHQLSPHFPNNASSHSHRNFKSEVRSWAAFRLSNPSLSPSAAGLRFFPPRIRNALHEAPVEQGEGEHRPQLRAVDGRAQRRQVDAGKEEGIYTYSLFGEFLEHCGCGMWDIEDV